MNKTEDLDTSSKIKLRKRAGWSMTVTGVLNLLFSIILLLIFSVILVFGFNELSEVIDESDPYAQVAISWVLMIIIFFMLILIFNVLSSIFVISAGWNMKIGKRRTYVTIVTVLWTTIISGLFLFSVMVMLFHVTLFSIFILIFSIVWMVILCYFFYSLSGSWDTFQINKGNKGQDG